MNGETLQFHSSAVFNGQSDPLLELFVLAEV